MERERANEENGRDGVNEDLCKELVRAAERGETERVKELLRREGVDVHHAEGMHVAWKKTGFLAACAGGHLETARVILEYGGQTQGELEDSFMAAAREGGREIVKMLMERGVGPSVRDNEAVCWAAARGHCDVLQVLLRDPRVDPAAQNQWTIGLAAYYA